jgi:hypothetical protein
MQISKMLSNMFLRMLSEMLQKSKSIGQFDVGQHFVPCVWGSRTLTCSSTFCAGASANLGTHIRLM